MPKLNQQGVVHFVLPLLLLAGIAVAVYLVTQGTPLKWFSKASNPPIVFKSSAGAPLPNNSDGVPTTFSASVKIEFTSTLGPPPGGVSSTVSGPTQSITQAFRYAENPTDLDTALYKPYNLEPTTVDYTFVDPTPGQKFIWVEFRDVAGTTDRRSAQIIISSAEVSVSVSPSTVVKNSDLTVKWLGLTNPVEKDWIGFFKKNDPVDSSHLKHWFFIGSCTKNSQGQVPAEFGSCSITIPTSLDQGEYDLRLMTNNTYSVVGSASVIVTGQPRGGGQPTVNVPSQAAAGSEIAILYAGLTGAVEKDWAGLFKQGDPSVGSRLRAWLFLGSCSKNSQGRIPAEAGSCNMTIPANLPNGVYEVRLMTDNTYNVIATSNPIGVGTAVPSPTPSPTPQSSMRVFVTSTTYNGNLEGLSGADDKCQERASTANLGGSWKAWLSDSTTAVSSRLNHSDLPYKLLNGITVANNWTDLTDGTIQTQIAITELGTGLSFPSGAVPWVRTNTNTNGSIYAQSASCDNWASNDGSKWGSIGYPTMRDERWTNVALQNCGNVTHLYCFEQ